MYVKDHSRANRGADLERLIRLANERYQHKRIAVITKQATEFIPLRGRNGKITGAKVEHKAVSDFIGRYHQFPIAIEAKNTNTDSIRFDAIQSHQADFLDAFTAERGTIGLVVVSFGMKRFHVVPWAFWQAAYNTRVRRGDRTARVTVSAFGQTWDIPPKYSVRESELNPLWRIPSHDPIFGFHYLKDAEKYVIDLGE